MSWIALLEALRYWAAVLFAIAVPPTIGWWLLVHPFAGTWRRLGSKLSLALLLGLYLVAAAGLFLVRDAILWRDLGFRIWAAALGAPLLVVSGLVARARKRHLGWRTLVGVPEVSSDRSESRLLQEGIYARIRNPRYVEFDLGLIGWTLILGYIGLYVVTAVTILAVHGIVLLEERELRDRFGAEYVEYSARVPRYLPRR